MTSVIILVFAVFLCLVNAVVWTLIAEMPLMGSAWMLAAAGCFWLQRWSRG
jgi:hypothetical protein